MKDSTCNEVSGAAWMMRMFLGGYLLVMGLTMLLGYQGSVDYLMNASGNPQLGMLMPVKNVVAMLVAYSWPVVKPLIGLSLLTGIKKFWSLTALYVYLLLFLLSHMMASDVSGASFVLLMVLFVSCMMAFSGMSGSKK